MLPKNKKNKNDLFFFTGHFIFKQWEFSVITEHCYCHKSAMHHLMLHKVNNKSWAHWSVGGNGTLCSWVQSTPNYTDDCTQHMSLHIVCRWQRNPVEPFIYTKNSAFDLWEIKMAAATSADKWSTVIHLSFWGKFHNSAAHALPTLTIQ